MWSVADFARINNPNELRELNQAVGNIADAANNLMGDSLDLQMDNQEIQVQAGEASAEFGPQMTMSGGGWMAIPVPNIPSLLAHIPIGKSRSVAALAGETLALGRWALKRIQIPLLNLESGLRQNGMTMEASQVGVTTAIIDNMYSVTFDRLGDFKPFTDRYEEIKETYAKKGLTIEYLGLASGNALSITALRV